MKESKVEATMRIGQQGITDAVVAELRAQLKRRKVVKVKRLRATSVEGKEKDFWQELARRAGVRLLEVRGHTGLLAVPGYVTEREAKKGRGARRGRDEEE